MITFTATPDPTTGTVDLVVTPTTETVTAIQRRDANGIRPVRTLAGLLPANGSIATVDSEASLKGNVTYQVVTSTGPGPQRTVALNAPGWWLVDPMLPTYATPLERVMETTATRVNTTTWHEVIGRPDPVATIKSLGARTGTYTLWAGTYEDAVGLVALYDQERVLLLRQGLYGGMDCYHLAETTTIAPYDPEGRRWQVVVAYREVAAPAGALLTQPGWTYDDLAATYPTYDSLMFAFASYNALTLGDPL